MKKVYSEKKYVEWKTAFAAKNLRSKEYREWRRKLYRAEKSLFTKWEDHEPIPAPANFRFIDDTMDCLNFFRRIRDKRNHYYREGKYFVALELKRVEQIDYASVSVLKALLLDLKPQRTFVQGSSPINSDCFNFLKTSGFYDGLLSLTDKSFHEKGNSDRIMFAQGAGMLSDEEDFAVLKILKKIRKHLTGQDAHCPQLRTIILEICGNSIEHSQSFNKQWMFGVKYETDRVIITLIDTGKEILKTLYRGRGGKFSCFIS